MALYRFEAKIISRSGGKRSTVGAAAYRTGKCATASAAYRAGGALTDERTGKRFDYTRMRGVLGAEIMLPNGAPEWMQNRGQLWNAIEKVEKRYDAQLARDFVISLPFELPHEERVALTRSFVRPHFVAEGFVADVAWHSPERGGDRRNFHAHVMVTLRRALEDGFARTKERAPGKLHPMEHWKAELEKLRVAWAEHGATALEKAGLHLEAVRFRAGHMTLEKQREAAIARGDHAWAEQLDREAEPKQGPLATKIEREGRESHAGADRRDVQRRNAELADLKAEHAAITAEIFNLELERVKRGHMEPLTDDSLSQQPKREAELLEQAKKREAEFAELRERWRRQYEEARQHEEERCRDDAKRRSDGEVADAKARYAEAVGQHYDIRDPYDSLARAAMAEYAAFAKQQEEYRRQEAAERDPEKRKLIQLAREIEAHDYMAITSERLSGISRVVAGHDAEKRARAEGRSTQAQLDDARAEAYRNGASELREERRELFAQIERRQRREVGERLGELARDVDRGERFERAPGRDAQDHARREEADKTERKVAGRSGELSDRGQRVVNDRISNLFAGTEQEHAARAGRSRGRGRD